MATINQYHGKICTKHIELEGLRARPHYRCVACFRAYQQMAHKRRYAAKKAKLAEESKNAKA